jgi:polyisoprenoid-binding protein YceI
MTRAEKAAYRGHRKGRSATRSALHLFVTTIVMVAIPGNAQHKTAKAATAPVKFTLVPAKSKIQFYVSSSLSDINGVFKTWTGTLKIPNPSSVNGVALKLNIDANSMTTGSSIKDGVITGKDFFDVEQYPTITFVSTKVMATSDPTKYQIQGNFTLRGVTKPVTLDVTLNEEGTVQGVIHGDLAFDRRDFGMTKNIPFNKVADTVKVTLDIDVERSAPSHVGK